MKLTYNDIVSAKEWAAQYAGEDDPCEVMAHKLLEIVAKSHAENAGYHERSETEARKLMAEIEARFKVDDSAEF